MHNRHTVEQAKSNLIAEMRQNHATLDENLPKLKKNEQVLSRVLTDLQKLRAKRNAKLEDINLNLNFFSLSEASWRTAQATGALSLMKYDQVEDFAGYYDIQGMLNRLAESLENAWLDMIAAFNPLGSDPTKMSDQQLDELQRRIQLSLGRLVAVENIGHALNDEYGKRLKKNN